jgi:hypothetical protein
MLKYGLNPTGEVLCPMAGLCVHGNETPGPEKIGKYL